MRPVREKHVSMEPIFKTKAGATTIIIWVPRAKREAGLRVSESKNLNAAKASMSLNRKKVGLQEEEKAEFYTGGMTKS